MGPTLEITISALNLWVNATLTLKSIASEDSFKKFPPKNSKSGPSCPTSPIPQSHLVSLPSSGSYETKMPWFLRINPAGTVPVLIHDGHPVYESHEQIVYIDDILRKDGVPSLR